MMRGKAFCISWWIYVYRHHVEMQGHGEKKAKKNVEYLLVSNSLVFLICEKVHKKKTKKKLKNTHSRGGT